MFKINQYSEPAIQQLFDLLTNKQRQGTQVEFEIKVDNFQVVPRTADLSRFHYYRDHVHPESTILMFLVYKGNSRRYDKFVFKFSQVSDAEQTVQEKINEALEKSRREFEFKELKKKVKKLKRKNSVLKDQVETLEGEAKNGTMMQQLMGAWNKFSGNAPQEAMLDGVSNDQLLAMLQNMKNQLGDDQFQSLLGTAVLLTQNPHLIPKVRVFVEQHTKNQ